MFKFYTRGSINMKKRIRYVLCVIFVVVFMTGSITYAEPELSKPEEIIVEPKVVCSNGCSGLCLLLCEQTPYLDGTSTHSYDFWSKTCTVKWYRDNYIGWACFTCGHVQPITDFNVNGLHDCYEQHMNCGDGKISYCHHGMVM